MSSDGRFAYTANASTNDVSGYGIASDGELSLVAGIAGTAATGVVDLDLTTGDGFLYVLSSGTGAITGFSADATDGSLTGIGGASGLAAGSAGLIAV